MTNLIASTVHVRLDPREGFLAVAILLFVAYVILRVITGNDDDEDYG